MYMSHSHALTKRQINCLERLTQRQIHRLERLPRDHEVVSIADGPLIVRGPKGKLLRVKANGRLVALVARFRYYLHVNG
jgi:hypothetical protein